MCRLAGAVRAGNVCCWTGNQLVLQGWWSLPPRVAVAVWADCCVMGASFWWEGLVSRADTLQREVGAGTLGGPQFVLFLWVGIWIWKILVLFREKVLILNGSPLEILSVDPVWPYCLRSESQQQLWVLVLLLEEHHFASPASDSQIKFWPLREGLVKPNLSWLLSHGKTFDFKTRVLKLVMWEVEQRTRFMTASVYLCSPLAPIAFLPQGYWALFRGKLRQC